MLGGFVLPVDQFGAAGTNFPHSTRNTPYASLPLVRKREKATEFSEALENAAAAIRSFQLTMSIFLGLLSWKCFCRRTSISSD